MPLTYAFRPFVFSLAFIRNMRSGGIFVPVRATSFSRSATSPACSFASGSNLSKIGSRNGDPNTDSNINGTVTSQAPNQYRFGQRFTIQLKSSRIGAPITIDSPSALPRSRNHGPQPSTLIPKARL